MLKSNINEIQIDQNKISICRSGSNTCFQERKYIIFESSLLELFKSCPECAAPSLASISFTRGTQVGIQQNCGVCGSSRTWTNEPAAGRMPTGNLLLSASILLSGSVTIKTTYERQPAPKYHLYYNNLIPMPILLSWSTAFLSALYYHVKLLIFYLCL